MFFIAHSVSLFLIHSDASFPPFSFMMSAIAAILLLFAASKPETNIAKIALIYAAGRSALGLLFGIPSLSGLLRIYNLTENPILHLTGNVWPWPFFAATIFFAFRHAPHKFGMSWIKLLALVAAAAIALFLIGLGLLFLIVRNISLT